MSGTLIGGDEVNAIVLDVGTYQVKAGYAGEDTPKFVFPTAVGVGGAPISNGSDKKDKDKMDIDGGAGAYHVGTHALGFRRDGMEIVSPFTDGVLSDWDAVEALWDHALKQQMRLATEEHPFLLAEPSHNTKEAREKMVELMFEKYNAPATFLAKNAVLSSFSMARQTSLVVDVGHEATVVAAVHDGFVLNKSIIRSPLAGHLLTRCVQSAVESEGTEVRPRYEFRRAETAPGKFKTEYTKHPGTTASYRAYQVDAICQDIKHTLCRVSETPFNPEENAALPTATYELPDGQEIHVGASRFTVPEVLFNPSLLSEFGDEVMAAARPGGGAAPQPQGLPTVVAECIGRCDVDVRRELYAGVVLTGGTSLFGSLRDRLEKEVVETAPPTMVKVKVTAATNAVERRYSTWIGGSILASLGTFQQMWMSKEEYKEHGAGLIHKKAP